MRRLFCGLAALAVLAFAPRSQAGYLVTDLGSLGGGTAVASGINNSGQVVGWSYTAGYQHHAFLYTGGVMTDLGTVGGSSNPYSYSWASGINNSGQVVGTFVAPSGYDHAFLYGGGVMKDLGTLGGYSSSATAINNSGQVVGTSVPAAPPHAVVMSQAFLYNPGGKMTNLGVPVGQSSATGINDSGVVVGITNGASPFRYSGGVVSWLPAPFGVNSNYAGINNAGQIVSAGNFWSALPGSANGYHAYLDTGGTLTPLGTLGGSFTLPAAINNLGQVVGSSATGAGATQHAFLFSGGKITDLNGWLAPGSGLVLVSATGINDKGQIVANASNGHAYLLTPDGLAATPEPSSLALLALGAAGLLGRAWRRRQAHRAGPPA